MENLPPDEDQYALFRLTALERFREMEINWESDLHEIVTLVSEMCETSAAVLHLPFRHKQLHFARPGIITGGKEGSLSVFAHQITKPGILCVEDTLSAGLPVTGADAAAGLPFRFFAGIALFNAHGHNLGSLFVLDVKPGKLTARQDVCLRMLAKQAVRVLDLSLSLKIVCDLITEIDNSEIRLKAFFDSTSSNIALIGRNFELLYFNKPVAEFIKNQLGRYPVLGDDYRQFVPPASIKMFMECIAKALRGERSIGERVIQYGDGPALWWEIMYSPVSDSSGNIIAASLQAKNIDERKLFEEKIKSQNLQFRKIAQLQSHQVRGPLTTVMGLMNIIKEDPDNAQEYLRLMDTAIKHLDDNIHSIVEKTVNI